MTAALTSGRARLDDLAAAWSVAVEHVTESERAVLGFGLQGQRAVVLKVCAPGSEERHAADVLEAFDGRGAVRVYARAPGALLVERAVSGRSLEDVVANDGDDEATCVLATVIARMSPEAVPRDVPTVEQWGMAFAHYQASGDQQIPAALLSAAAGVYTRLASTQRHGRLLHGDLHHGNVVLDGDRGWLSIDPKGVVGEIEFELGAALRNPWDRPSLFTDPGVIRRRVRVLCDALHLDESRVAGWAFAQAVLSAVWTIEDERRLDCDSPLLVLAETLRVSVGE